MTPEEKREIIDTVKTELVPAFENHIKDLEDRLKIYVEKAGEKNLLALPEVWSSLGLDIEAQSKQKEKFYKDHPEFKGHEESVKSVIAQTDGQNPNMDIKDMLNKAVPEIKRRIDQTKGLSMTVNPKPDTTFQPLNTPSNNGRL